MKPMGTPTRADDLIASYSSKGPTLLDHIVKPDIVAPGNLMISVLALFERDFGEASPKNVVAVSPYTANGKSTASYFTLSGTSMATPVVSGAVALLLQKNGSLTPDQVKAETFSIELISNLHIEQTLSQFADSFHRRGRVAHPVGEVQRKLDGAVSAAPPASGCEPRVAWAGVFRR